MEHLVLFFFFYLFGFVFLCNAAHATFFLFLTSVTKQHITNYIEVHTLLFSNLLVTSCKEAGVWEGEKNQSTSKVEYE